MFVKNYTTGKCYSYGEEITQEKYDEIMAMLRNRPEAPGGYVYALNADLEWELQELPAEVMTETEQKAQAYDILMGVAE